MGRGAGGDFDFLTEFFFPCKVAEFVLQTTIDAKTVVCHCPTLSLSLPQRHHPDSPDCATLQGVVALLPKFKEQPLW